MRLATWFCFVILMAFLLKPVRAQNTDDNLKVYAVSVMDVVPFQRHVSGFGIYIGKGAFITAAHVVGYWSIFANPRLLIAGQEMAAKVIKKGSFEQIDLA